MHLSKRRPTSTQAQESERGRREEMNPTDQRSITSQTHLWLALTALSSALGLALPLLERYLKLFEKDSALKPYSGAGLLVLAVVFFFIWRRVSAHEVSTIARPELVCLKVRSVGDLLGRESDVENLVSLCIKEKQIHLIGESGVGKSSLLNVGILPELDRRGIRTLYLDSLVGSEDLARTALATALWSRLSRDERQAAGLPINPDASRSAEVLRNIRSQTPFPIVIAFDTFELYLVTQRDDLRSVDGSWIDSSELLAKNRFWAELALLQREGVISLLFVARNDDSSALCAFGFTTPKVRPLFPLGSETIIQRLNDLSNAGFVARPNLGWDVLKMRLAADLSPDGVLPAQMTLALRGLMQLPRLTLREYLRVGALPGIESMVIRKHLAGAARTSGLREHDVLTMLTSVFDRKTGEPQPLTVANFHQLLRERRELNQGDRVSPAKIDKALEFFEIHNVLRKRADPSTNEPAWCLYHDYLHRAIRHTERQMNVWSFRLEAQHEAFRNSTGPLHQWGVLLPIILQIQLLYQRLRGRLQFGPHRGFAILSSLRFLPLVCLLLVPVLAADAGLLFPGSLVIQQQLTASGISFFRHIHTRSEILAAARDQAQQLAHVLDSRVSETGWELPEVPQKVLPDLWAHAQALRARLADATVAGKQAKELVRRINLMFSDQYLFRDSDGVKVGWPASVKVDYARVEPLVWTVSALASVLPRINPADIETRQIAETRLRETESIAERYFQATTGGWNRFPTQDDNTVHSTYASLMALQMLLDCKDAGFDYHVGQHTADEVIRNTGRWLKQSYGCDLNQCGWREMPADPDSQTILRNLSLQSFSILLRAQEFIGWKLSGFLTPKMIGDIRSLLVSGAHTDRDAGQRLTLGFFDHLGRQRTSDDNIVFLGLPWATELGRLGLALAPRLGLSEREIRLIRHNLGDLLILEGSKYTRDATTRATYLASEFLLVLGSVSSI